MNSSEGLQEILSPAQVDRKRKKEMNQTGHKRNITVETLNQTANGNNSSMMGSAYNNSSVKNMKASEFQSSFTLQHSIPSISFTKAIRFPSSTKEGSSVLDSAEIKYPFSTKYKAISFGYGEKVCLPPYILKNAS